jgi:phosphatidate cytidylyltransferase
MRARLASGFSLGAALLLVTWSGGLPFVAAIAVGVVVALSEFYTLATAGGARPLALPAMVGAVLVVMSAGLAWPSHWTAALAAGTTIGTASLLLLGRGGASSRRVLMDWGATIAGLAYVVPPAALLLSLRAGARGLAWVVLLYVVTWSCDSGAYFAGRAFGRTPFFPAISPKKTREGALAGLLAGAAGALVVSRAAGLPLHPLLALVAGASIAVAAVAGDLVESLFKRQVGVKDSGRLIPGHGGLLDRVDSLLFAVVVTFYWYLFTNV